MTRSYETLLASIKLLSSTRPLKSLLVTGTQPGEGKTTVSVNLALTATLAGKKVLLLEGDFRKPQFDRIFRIENRLGLADILTSGALPHEVAQTVSISDGDHRAQHSLTVITSGDVSAGVVTAIQASAFPKTLERLEAEYDMILLDTPPVLATSDALVFAPAVDGIILVLDTGSTAERDAALAKERLQQAGGNVLGIVLNRFDAKVHGSPLYPHSGAY